MDLGSFVQLSRILLMKKKISPLHVYFIDFLANLTHSDELFPAAAVMSCEKRGFTLIL